MLPWIVQSLVVAALLAGIVALICHLGRLGPAARHVLWLIVLVKLVMPPVFFWPWEPPISFRLDDAWNAILGVDETQREPRSAQKYSKVDRPTPTTSPPDVDSDAFVLSCDDFRITIEEVEPQTEHGTPPSPSGLALTVRSATGHSESIVADAPRQTMQSFQSSTKPATLTATPADFPTSRSLFDRVLLAAGLVWWAGAALMAVTQLVRIRRMNRQLKQAEPAPDWLIREVAKLAQCLNVRPPAIRVVAQVGSPCLWGWGRAKLLWPRALMEDSAQSWRGVIVHELAHLRRRDHWGGWLELVGGCVWWWNPLFWYVRHQVRNNAELACDAWVVGTLPDGRRAYAEALLAVCQFASQTASPMSALGVGSGARRDFERRLTMILRERVPLRVPRLGLLAVALLAAVALPSWSQSADEQPEESPSPTFDLPIADVAPVLPEADDISAAESAPTKPASRARAVDDHPAELPSLDGDDDDLPMAAEVFVFPSAPPAPLGTSRSTKASADTAAESVKSKAADRAPFAGRDRQLQMLEQQLKAAQAELSRWRNSVPNDAEVDEAAAVSADGEDADDEMHPDASVASPSPYRPQPQHVVESSTYTFSRTTYKLAAPKAQALAQFLEQNIDGPNLLSATASGEDTLTVIAVPETQQVVGQFVALLQADAEQADKDNPLRKFRSSLPDGATRMVPVREPVPGDPPKYIIKYVPASELPTAAGAPESKANKRDDPFVPQYEPPARHSAEPFFNGSDDGFAPATSAPVPSQNRPATKATPKR